MTEIEYVLLGASILLIVSIIASKAASRLGIPTLLLFLFIGMLAGSDGLGGIYFDDPRLAQSIGVVALAYILFAGGLDTEWQSVRPVLWRGLTLSTLGVLITAVLLGWFATVALGFTWLEGLLLGAIVSSTDAAAVFAVLRSRSVGLRGHLKPLLELESGSNDPMAVFLTAGFTSLLVQPDAAITDLIPAFVQQMALGAGLGYVMGRGMVLLTNRARLEYEGLYPVLTLALVLLTYGATTVVEGNGFLAVYVAGLVMGNSTFVHKKSLMRFHDGVAWLMQIVMFLTLGLLVFPSRLPPIMGAGLLTAAFLMFVARPVAVFVALLPVRMALREKLMVAWVGLRGAVPIILATFPLLARVPQADLFFNLVFFIVLTSVLLQGTSIPFIARWLRVDAPFKRKFHSPLEFVPTVSVNSELAELVIPRGSPAVGRSIMELNLPPGALVVLVNRNDDTIVPNGATVLQAGDAVLVLVENDALPEVRRLVESASPKAQAF